MKAGVLAAYENGIEEAPEKSSLKLSQRQSQKVVSRISAMAMISFIYMSVDGYPIQCHSRRSQKK